MKRLLLIIDPQIDFINGSLPVPGAVEAMDSLAEYIKANASRYEAIAITADCHPADHQSFQPQGGEWPVHCVRFSVGGAIWPAVYEAALASGCKVDVFPKGDRADVEEYSVFQNPSSRSELIHLVNKLDITDIAICGLAGDVCVLSSLRDALDLFPTLTFHVLTAFSPSLDGGAKLGVFMEQHGIK